MHYTIPKPYTNKSTRHNKQNEKCGPHTLCTFFFAFLLPINSLFHLIAFAPKRLASTTSLASPHRMEARSIERKRALTMEKVRRNKTVEEEVENEVEEEDESGGGGVSLTEEEKKKGVGGGGRRGGSSGGGGVSPPTCQAEKCGVDLTDAKRYHRRHKVCEFHSKEPIVVVAGLRQRFCQQCSRFHDLGEFDEAKRSCRRRLAGHNERRRKSNPEAGNEGSKGQHHTKETTQCRHADERGRVQMNLLGTSSGYKSFNIR